MNKIATPWRTALRRGLMSIALLAGAVIAVPVDAARLAIQDNDQNNLFPVGQPVQFEAAIHDIGPGSGEVTVQVTNFTGKQRTVKVPVTSTEGRTIRFTIDLGEMQPGYYEMDASLHYQDTAGQVITADYSRPIPFIRGKEKFTREEPFSFGVVHFVDRTAQEAREQGARFGLKIWQLGSPGVWWRKGTVYDLNKFIDSTVKLGLQWTRHDFPAAPDPEEPGKIGNHELIENHQVNVVWKVEGYPLDTMWDEQRYGSLEEWKKKNGSRNPSRRTIPKKEPYQAWLKELINALPPDQTIFEIGNEVWNYMSGADYAEWVQIATEAIKEARPNAKVGVDAGFWGHTKFFEPFAAAGGLKNVDIIILHPYSFTPQPEHRIRQVLRTVRDGLRERTGQEFEIYVTEYGWPTAPEDRRGHSVSEALQAMRTTRQSLMMYAEDVKTLIPHWTADREYDVTEREHFFGFFRLSGPPKPVLIAHAIAARMIDTSRFVGDLWYGPGIGAMLFERDGEYTLALWTLEEDRTVEIDTAADEVTVVDLMGAAEQRQTSNGKLTLDLSGAVTYVVGVGEQLARQATPPDQPLNPDRWSTREGSFTASRAQGMQIDGDLSEWDGVEAVKLTGETTASAEAMFKWDEKTLYAAIRVNNADDKPGVFTVNLSTRPELGSTGLMYYDWAFTLVPGKDGDFGRLSLKRGMSAETGEYRNGRSDPGHRWAVKAHDGGWTAELAMPTSKLAGFPEPQVGTKIGVKLEYKQGDKVATYGEKEVRLWPYLTFEQ